MILKREVFVSRNVIFFEDEEGSLLLKEHYGSKEINFFRFRDETANVQDASLNKEISNIIEDEDSIHFEDSSSGTNEFIDVMYSGEESDGTSGDSDFAPSKQPGVVEQSVTQQREHRIRKSKILEDFVTYSAIINECEDPTTVQEAHNRKEKKKWLQAMNNEYKALIDNGT